MMTYEEYNKSYNGFIYETTCTVNGMKYIGRKGRTNNPDDPDDAWYLGSPFNSQFWDDLDKYGVESFTRRMLDNGPLTFEESIEKELYYQRLNNVDTNPEYYNLSIWSSPYFQVGEYNPKFGKLYVTDGPTELIIKPEELDYYESIGYHRGRKDSVREACRQAHLGKPKSDEARRHMSASWSYEKHITEEFREKQRIRCTLNNPMKNPETTKKLSETVTGEGNPFYGHQHSEENKLRWSESKKGEGNPCYGKKLMNNGERNEFVKESEIPLYESEGWVLGRLRK